MSFSNVDKRVVRELCNLFESKRDNTSQYKGGKISPNFKPQPLSRAYQHPHPAPAKPTFPGSINMKDTAVTTGRETAATTIGEATTSTILATGDEPGQGDAHTEDQEPDSQLNSAQDDPMALGCGAESDSSDDEEFSDHPSNTLGAYVERTKIWRRKTALKVFFMDEDELTSWTLDRSPMNIDNILAWANKWNTGLTPDIPEFIKEDVITKADIRVSFGRSKSCWSKVGSDAASVPKTEPTMNLYLKNYSADFQCYLVVHEFGHVLGLLHEHQRSDFWKVGIKFLDLRKMRSDRRMQHVKFDTDMLNLSFKSYMSSYDPESVMHYWFDVKWLKGKYEKYQDISQVKSSKKLTNDQRKVLLGIHRNSGTNFAQKPSETDLLFLQDCYSRRHSPSKTSSKLKVSSGPTSHLGSEDVLMCSDCSPEQSQSLQLVTKQLEYLHKIRNTDKDSIKTVVFGSLLDYIDGFLRTKSPDFPHLKSHLQALYDKQLIADPLVLERVLTQVQVMEDGTKPLFNKDVVYHASLCCLAVNDRMALQRGTCKYGHSFDEVSISCNEKQCYLIARQGESTYYIAFKGITDIREWLIYSSFTEGINAQVNSFPIQFIEDLLTDKTNRVVMTGFSFGGLLASSITTKLWQSTFMSWNHLHESLTCISFAQPHLPVPELDTISLETPLIAQSIHLIYYEHDKIPLVISLLNQKCSALLVERSISEPGLKFSLHEEPQTAFDDHLTRTLISNLGALMNSRDSGYQRMDSQKELQKSLSVISPKAATQMQNAYSKYFTHYSLCTDHRENGLTFNKVAVKEVRSWFTVDDVDTLIMNHKKHSMEVYADKLVKGYLEKSSDYTIPSNHTTPQPLFKAQPSLSKVEIADSSSSLSLTFTGDHLWFCTMFEVDGLEFHVNPSTNSQTSINSRLSDIDSSALGDLSNGDKICVTLHSDFVQLQQIYTTIQKKEYAQTVRQHHIEALLPSQLIKLAYISALLEREPQGHFTDSNSQKVNIIQDFIEKAQKTVPLESIGTAIRSKNRYVSQTCAQVVSERGGKLPFCSTICDLAERTLMRLPSIENGGGSSLCDSTGALTLGKFEMATDKPCTTNINYLYPVCFPNNPYDVLIKSKEELESLIKNDAGHPDDSLIRNGSTATKVVNEIRQETLAICVSLLGKYFERQKIFVQHGALPRLHDLAEERLLELLSKGESKENFSLETSLLTTLKDQPYAAEIGYSFLLEGQIVKLCKEQGITQSYFLDTLIGNWKQKFKGSPLALIVDSHIPVVARWLKWGLMVNSLRCNLISTFPPAIGVVGLMNSGKTKLVHSLFGIQVSSGTSEKERTTVPFIYNLHDTVGDVDIIDFPGIDNLHESMFDMADLILNLAQVIIFVVDYRSVTSESSRSWLSKLQGKDVPMLVCLSYADKFYAEQMTDNGQHPVESETIEKLQRKLKTIKFECKMPGSLDVKFCTFSQDKDSIFNNEKERTKLQKVGISTPKKVGEWLASTFENKLGNSSLSAKITHYLKQNQHIC